MIRVLAAVALLLGLVLRAGDARAHVNGTVFSSPVDGDGQALYWNPAAMAASKTSRFDLVANFSVPQSTYTRRGVDGAQTGRPFPKVGLVSSRPEPAIGLIIDKLWHRRLRIGVDFNVPSASGAAWPEYTTDGAGQRVLGPTRYHVTGASVFTAMAQIGASIALHETVAIGAAINVVVSRLDVNKHVDLANQGVARAAVPCAQNPLGCENPGLSTPLHLAGTGVSVGGSVGLMWQPIPRLRFGIGYVSPVKIPVAINIGLDFAKIEQFARDFISGFGKLSLEGTGTAEVTVPMRLHVAIAGDVHRRVELMAMLRWINYSAAEIISGSISQRTSDLVPAALRIANVRNDEWMVTVRVVGRVRERWKLGASLEYVSKTVPDVYMTPSNLDFDTLLINLAANVRLTRVLALGASFSQAIVFSREITRSAFSNESPEPFNLPDPGGVYTGNSEKIGLDLSAIF